MIDWNDDQRRGAASCSPGWACDENPDTPIKDIGVGKQQLVEIAKALSKEVKLLILDEPTAALNDERLPAPARPACAGLRERGHHLDHHLATSSTRSSDRRLDHDHPRRQDHRDPRRQGGRRRPRTGSSAAWSAATWSTASPTTTPEIGEVLLRGRGLDGPPPAASGPAGRQERQLQRPPRRDRRLRRPDGRRPHRAGDERLRPLLRHLHQRHASFKDGKEIAAQVGRRGDRRRHRLRHRGPQDARPQPDRRHQAHHVSAGLGKRITRGWSSTSDEEYKVAEDYRKSA